MLAWASLETMYLSDFSRDTSKTIEEYRTKENLGNLLRDTGEVKALLDNGDGTYTVEYLPNGQKTVYAFNLDGTGNWTAGAQWEDAEPQLLATTITAENYGDRVRYSANGITDWKILYNDGENVFIVTSDYLAHGGNADTSKIVSGTGMTKTGTYLAYWSPDPNTAKTLVEANVTKFSPVISGETKAWQGDYSTNANGRSVSTLLDTTLWSNYLDNNGYGEMAIGSPTLNMFVASWNAKYPTEKLYCNNDTAIGYCVGTSPTPETKYIGSATIQAMNGFSDLLYYPHSDASNHPYKSCYGYWLASPGALFDYTLMCVMCDAPVEARGYNDTISCAVRPVVCLKSEVLGIKKGDIWDLSIPLSKAVTAENYGDKVRYSANGVTDWKILYNDGENVFIVTSDYLAHGGSTDTSKIVSGTGMMKTGMYQAYWNGAPNSAAITTNVAKFSPVISGETKAWQGSYSTNGNGRSVSTLLDTTLWSQYLNTTEGTAGYNCGEMAIGSPTLNMLVASWNAKYPSQKIYCNNDDATGYYVGTETSPESTYIDSTTMQAKSGYSETLYYPHSDTSGNAYNGCYGYWLASPSANHTGDLMYLNCNGYVSRIGFYGTYCSVRPVVCLDSAVIGTKSGNTWTISK